MDKFIPGLAKHPEKRKITQTEKRQRDCVYDRSKRNRRYIKEWEKEYACLAYDDETNAMLCSSTSCCGGGQDNASTIGIRGNNAFATDESRTSKGSSIIVIIFTSVHSVRWGEGVKGDRTLF